jgi:hypothetical protein
VTQDLDRRSPTDCGWGFGGIRGLQQGQAIGPNGGGQQLPIRVGFGEPVVLRPVAVALTPLAKAAEGALVLNPQPITAHWGVPPKDLTYWPMMAARSCVEPPSIVATPSRIATLAASTTAADSVS